MLDFFKKTQSSEKHKKNSTNSFYDSHYQVHNIARLQHLDSLELNLSKKKVLELGAGVGDHTLFYLYRNCDITPVEGRIELVNHINQRLGTNKAIKINFENELEKLNNFQDFDFVHCYGLLYHLSNPKEFLEAVRNTGNTLLLETCLSKETAIDDINLIQEADSPTQAISFTGCRPKRSWLYKQLKSLYSYVYLPKTQPEHKEFIKDWTSDSRPEHLIRGIFIASHKPIDNPNLTAELINVYN
jgi:SAM-dependent methyltransferase